MIRLSISFLDIENEHLFNAQAGGTPVVALKRHLPQDAPPTNDYDLMERICAEGPTAVFVGGDAMALGALQTLDRMGARVPDDLSFVAFGNPDLVRFATPAITTVGLPVTGARRVAVELALARIRRPEDKEVRTLKTTLLVNDTTAAARGPP